MSPKVLEEGGLIFWFHSYDALHETRASVHVGKGMPDDDNDAKIWLEPEVEVARTGRTLREHELRRAVRTVQHQHAYLKEQWYDYRGRAG
jgi:gluconate kinase